MSQMTVYAPQRQLRHYDGTQLELIKRTVAKDTTQDEFSMFVEVCKRVGLDPFRRQIYCLVYSADKPDKRQCVFITGIDGFRAVAQRNGDYRPDEDEPIFVFDEEAKDAVTNPLGLVKATVYAYKRDQAGQWFRIAGVAYWQEFAPIEDEWAWVDDPSTGKRARRPTGKKKLSGKWTTMPQLMLAKCAEAQALRKGWPEDLSALYAPEEMARANLVETTAAEALEQHQQQARLAAVKSSLSIPIQWAPGEPIEFVADGQVMDRALAFIREAHPLQVNAWAEINAGGLREFWARHKADALALKKAIEAKAKEIDGDVGADGPSGVGTGPGTREVEGRGNAAAAEHSGRAAYDGLRTAHAGDRPKAGSAGPLFGKGS